MQILRKTTKTNTIQQPKTIWQSRKIKFLPVLVAIVSVAAFGAYYAHKASAASDLYFRWYWDKSQCLTDPGNDTTNGTYVVLWPCHSYTPGEQWGLRSVAGGWQIVTSNNMCMTDPAPKHPGTRIVVWHCNPTAQNQIWQPINNSKHYWMWWNYWNNGASDDVIGLYDSAIEPGIAQTENAQRIGNNTDQDWCVTYYNVNDKLYC